MVHRSASDTTFATQRPLSDRGRLRRAGRLLRRRRIMVATLNGATILTLAVAMGVVLFSTGFALAKVGMWLAFVTTLPWLSIGFWNAIIGTFVLARGEDGDDPLALEAPAFAPVTTRTALAMALRNEAPGPAIARVRAMLDDLAREGMAAHFDVHLLSDTDDPEIAAEEERLVAAWRAQSPLADQIFYRRRAVNTGYKAGNLEEFCRRAGEDYDFFLPLDADSFMGAAAVLRLVRIMQRHRRIGILQSLVVGTPATAFFTRVFQFGMRHGMRAYTAGSAWWTGDCGPYWGHNALIRTRAFRDHCSLPTLNGRGPLGGAIMSHDQVEAVLMRRAGYHVRVLAEEGESYEENPPTLPDFIRRELRWCQGNMQYFQLLAMPGLRPMSRVQLSLAILMYLGAPAWMAFMGFGVALLFGPAGVGDYPVGLGLAIFAAVMAMTFAPKLMGLAGVVASARESARYGGRGQVVLGGVVELLCSAIVAPVVAFAVAVFAVGLAFGQRLDWRAQSRAVRRVGWGEAITTFLPQTAAGIALFAVFAVMAPGVLPWAAPVIAGFVLAVPFAVLSAGEGVGRWATAVGLCAIPEEGQPHPTLSRLALAA